jgi:hypothetical protein
MACEQAARRAEKAITMIKTTPLDYPHSNPQAMFSHSPRPIRAEWERTINSIRPWLTPEKFKEAEEVHWRMFDRANSWYELGGRMRRENSR